MTETHDIVIIQPEHPHGTIMQMKPVSQRCKDWFEEHVQYEDWQVLGGYITMEARYANDLMHGLDEKGFVMVNKDGARYQKTEVA